MTGTIASGILLVLHAPGRRGNDVDPGALWPAMFARPPFGAAVVCLGMAFGCGGCTLVKPVSGLVTGPLYFEDEVGRVSGAASLEGAIGMVATIVVIGSLSGLATGIASDVLWLAGSTDTPTRNWTNPFRTNADVGDPGNRGQ